MIDPDGDLIQPPFDPEDRIDLLLRHLGTRRQGLSQREAARRLQQYGPNEIQRQESRSRLAELARQFTHPLALLLWVAAVLALLSGTPELAIAIVAVIVLKAILAFAQEFQAERLPELERSESLLLTYLSILTLIAMLVLAARFSRAHRPLPFGNPSPYFGARFKR